MAKKSVFPLKITYDTSLLTLITFAISIATLTWQIINYFEGPQVRLIAPDQITIGSSERVNFPIRDGGPYVHFVARLSYVNAAAASYNATVRAERVRVTVEGKPAFEYRWFRFVTSDAAGSQGTDLVVDKASDAHPFALAAGSSESHETLFQPWQKACAAAAADCKTDDNYIDWKTFVEWFGNQHVVEFEFLTDIYGQVDPVSAKCTVRMSDERFQNLAARKWGSPFCTTTG
jgi:hypothetical protein